MVYILYIYYIYIYIYIILYIYIYIYIYIHCIYIYTRIVKTFSKNVGISKPKKHTNKIGMVRTLAAKLK